MSIWVFNNIYDRLSNSTQSHAMKQEMFYSFVFGFAQKTSRFYLVLVEYCPITLEDVSARHQFQLSVDTWNL